MKIIFDSEEKCHGRIIFDTDWTYAKKIIDMIWNDMTINPFNEKVGKEHEEWLSKNF